MSREAIAKLRFEDAAWTTALRKLRSFPGSVWNRSNRPHQSAWAFDADRRGLALLSRWFSLPIMRPEGSLFKSDSHWSDKASFAGAVTQTSASS